MKSYRKKRMSRDYTRLNEIFEVILAYNAEDYEDFQYQWRIRNKAYNSTIKKADYLAKKINDKKDA